MSMEDAQTSLKTYLTANLEAEFVSIEAARDVTIPRYYEIVTRFSKARQFPNISIVPDSTAFEYGEIDEFLNPWNDHNVNILIAQSGGEQGAVQDDLIRYVEAIENITTGSRDKYSLGELVELVQHIEVAYSITIAEEDRSTIQVTAMSMIVRILQT